MASPQTELVGGFCVDKVTAEMLAMFEPKSRMKVLGAAFDVAFLRQADPTRLSTIEANLVRRIVDFSMRAVMHFENRLNQSRTANVSGVSRPKPDRNPTETRPPSPPKKRESSPHTPLKEKKYTPTPTHAHMREELFGKFWDAYPLKVGRKPALAKFESILKSEPNAFEDIMRGLKAEKRSDQWTKDGGKFIPHPTTWLNQERWKDAIANATPSVTANRVDELARKLLENG